MKQLSFFISFLFLFLFLFFFWTIAVPAPGFRDAADGGGGADRARRTRLGQAGRHLGRRHARLLPQTRLRTRRALHEQTTLLTTSTDRLPLPTRTAQGEETEHIKKNISTHSVGTGRRYRVFFFTEFHHLSLRVCSAEKNSAAIRFRSVDVTV